MNHHTREQPRATRCGDCGRIVNTRTHECVPCAAREADLCEGHMPVEQVAARDADAAALCGPCADALGILPEFF